LRAIPQANENGCNIIFENLNKIEVEDYQMSARDIGEISGMLISWPFLHVIDKFPYYRCQANWGVWKIWDYVSSAYHRTKKSSGETGECTGELLQLSLEGHKKGICSITFSRDGKRIVSGSEDNTIVLWDAQTGKQLLPPLEGHERDVQCVAFSPDTKRVVSGSNDTTIQLWDAETGRQLRVQRMFHSRQMASGSTHIQVGSDLLHSRQMAGAWHRGHTTTLSCCGIPRLASGYNRLSWDIRIVFYLLHSRQTGGALCRGQQTKQSMFGMQTLVNRWDPLLRDNQGIVTSVEFSMDGRIIVLGSLDKTIRLWVAYCMHG
jgi:WD40 repeat protein